MFKNRCNRFILIPKTPSKEIVNCKWYRRRRFIEWNDYKWAWRLRRQNVCRIELNSSLFIDIRFSRCRQKCMRCVRNSSWQFADWKQTCTANETGEVECDNRRINVENNDELNAMRTWQHDARTNSEALNYIRFVLHFYYVCWFILLFCGRNGIIAIIFEWHSFSNCQRCRLCRRRVTSTVQKKAN